jgi:mono/diheme cytochrome c family protein
MHRLTVAAGLCAFALIGAAALQAAAPEAQKTPAASKTLDGKELFVSQGCNTCHNVAAAGIAAKMKASKAPDLGKTTAAREPAWLTAYLRQQSDEKGKKHPKAFTGSDEQLGAVVAWLEEQKKKAKAGG